MESRKPLRTYLLVNVAVSAITTLVVLIIWNAVTNPAPESLPESPLALETSTPGPSPDPGEYDGQLQISSVIGAGDVQNERVTIEHIGEADVTLAGWTLEDENGNTYRFPGLVLHPGAVVELFSRQGEDNVTELFWNREDPVWNEGELATLLDPAAGEQASYTVP